MKLVTLEFVKPERDNNGYPIFGKIVIEINACNESAIISYLNKQFGKDNYNILKIE